MPLGPFGPFIPGFPSLPAGPGFPGAPASPCYKIENHSSTILDQSQSHSSSYLSLILLTAAPG